MLSAISVVSASSAVADSYFPKTISQQQVINLVFIRTFL